MRWLTIDPGMNCGIALFNDDRLVQWKNIYGKGNTFQEKAAYVCLQIPATFRTAFCEFPTSNFSGAKGLAARNSDALLKLCYLIGRLSTQFDSFTLVPVVKHIGQLPKAVNHARVRKYFSIPENTVLNHAGDALSLAKYVLQNNLI